MESAQKIVSALLEDEEEGDEEFNPRDYVVADRGVPVTPETAMTASTFYHRTKRYSAKNGKGRAIQVRRMGATKTWKRQPGKFRIPVKFGMKDSFYIDNDNANEWLTEEPA
jgi:hypothetical protein